MDRTNQISYTEFLAASVEAMGLSREEELAEAFDRLDSDDSGFISHENLKEILGSAYDAKEVERMIEEGDFKRNGRVDYDEFMKLMGEKRENEIAAAMELGSIAELETEHSGGADEAKTDLTST